MYHLILLRRNRRGAKADVLTSGANEPPPRVIPQSYTWSPPENDHNSGMRKGGVCEVEEEAAGGTSCVCVVAAAAGVTQHFLASPSASIPTTGTRPSFLIRLVGPTRCWEGLGTPQLGRKAGLVLPQSL